MARPGAKRPIDTERINSLASFSERQGAGEAEQIEPRRGRSKRNLPMAEDTTQVCFRIERNRHRALRVYCAENDIEIGEFMDTLLKSKGL